MDKKYKLVILGQAVLTFLFADFSLMNMVKSLNVTMNKEISLFSNIAIFSFIIIALFFYLGLELIKRRFLKRGWKYFIIFLGLLIATGLIRVLAANFGYKLDYSQLFWIVEAVILLLFTAANYFVRKKLEKPSDKKRFVKCVLFDDVMIFLYGFIVGIGNGFAVGVLIRLG